jgi:hypothetical protein
MSIVDRNSSWVDLWGWGDMVLVERYSACYLGSPYSTGERPFSLVLALTLCVNHDRMILDKSQVLLTKQV